jgi:hypothetical protein
MMYSTDFIWGKLEAFIDYEPVEFMPMDTRACIHRHHQGRAVQSGCGNAGSADPRNQRSSKALIFADRMTGRADGKDLYYTDRQYLSMWPDVTADWCGFF